MSKISIKETGRFFQTDTKGPGDKCWPHNSGRFYGKLKHLENLEKVLPCVATHNPDLRKGKKLVWEKLFSVGKIM